MWTLSQIVLDASATPVFLSCPVQWRVDLGKSKVMACDGEAAAVAAHAVPPRSVADTASITSARHTDMIAVLKEIGQTRVSKSGESIADVVLIDDSKTSTGQLAVVTVSVWGDAKIRQLQSSAGNAMAFF